MSEPSDRTWAVFDELTAAPWTDPWDCSEDVPVFSPDFDTLARLLSTVVTHGSSSASGLPAKAIDVWIARELRRAGFAADEVWPRALRPRVLSHDLSAMLTALPAQLAAELGRRLVTGVTGVSRQEATVLGRYYEKQVDIVMSRWDRGPELLISSKRMDSALSNNALNRIEESYGDAHNLRGRHPMAVIGYVLLIRRSAVRRSPDPATRLLDLVEKMGHDPLGYDATCVIIADWDESTGEVRLFPDDTSPGLRADRFLHRVVDLVLKRTPISAHVAARELRDKVRLPLPADTLTQQRDPGQAEGRAPGT